MSSSQSPLQGESPAIAGDSPGTRSTQARSTRVGETIFAGLTIALGVFTLTGVFTIHVPVGGRVGPTAFPVFVAALLLLAGVAVLVGVLRGKLGTPDDAEDTDRDARTDWLTVGKLVAALLAHLLLIELIGWALAGTVLFGVVAWVLGAKRWWLGFVIGFALSFAVQIVFGELLGLSLPLGPLFGWIAPLI